MGDTHNTNDEYKIFVENSLGKVSEHELDEMAHNRVHSWFSVVTDMNRRIT
jgi:hypothetical protein